MGDYMECILGCSIKNTKEVVDIMNYLLSTEKNKTTPDNYPFLISGTRIHWMFNSGGSYYFGANSGEHRFFYDEISNCWRLNARFNIKIGEDIDTFLQWLKPFITQGSGEREMYAIVISEFQSEPTIYYLVDAE